MERVVTLPPPNKLGTCRECRYWEKRLQRDSVVLNNGQVIPLEAYDTVKRAAAGQGGIVGIASDGAKLLTQAPCTLNPQWVMQADDCWCHRWLEGERQCLPPRELILRSD